MAIQGILALILLIQLRTCVSQIPTAEDQLVQTVVVGAGDSTVGLP